MVSFDRVRKAARVFFACPCSKGSRVDPAGRVGNLEKNQTDRLTVKAQDKAGQGRASRIYDEFFHHRAGLAQWFLVQSQAPSSSSVQTCQRAAIPVSCGGCNADRRSWSTCSVRHWTNKLRCSLPYLAYCSGHPGWRSGWSHGGSADWIQDCCQLSVLWSCRMGSSPCQGLLINVRDWPSNATSQAHIGHLFGHLECMTGVRPDVGREHHGITSPAADEFRGAQRVVQ